MPISKRANPNGPKSTVVRSILRMAAVVSLVSGVGLASAFAQDTRPVAAVEAPAAASVPAIPVAAVEPAVPAAPEAAPAAVSVIPVAVTGEAPAPAIAAPAKAAKEKHHDLSPWACSGTPIRS